MATRQNAGKSGKQSQTKTGSKLPAAPTKEEVGNWESEGGAPQGGRNPTAIKEGQAGLETGKQRQVSRQTGKVQPKPTKSR
jgi:hypothetical protein